MRRNTVLGRWLIYSLGVIILMIGLTLNTKTGLGISPVIAVSFSLSKVLEVKLSVVLFFYYVLTVAVQFLLRGKERRMRDLLQLPFALVSSLLMELFGILLDVHFTQLWQNILLTLLASSCIGIGVCMMVNMKLVANPADALVEAMSWKFGKKLGVMKNTLDVISVIIAFSIDVCFGEIWTGIGLGTVINMILTGRVIDLCNRLFREKMLRAAGLAAAAEAGGVK